VSNVRHSQKSSGLEGMVLRILQFGVEDDVPFLVMEYASTLRQLTLAVNDEV
jgi:hypothetical protein